MIHPRDPLVARLQAAAGPQDEGFWQRIAEECMAFATEEVLRYEARARRLAE